MIAAERHRIAGKPERSYDTAERVAIAMLGWLVQDEERVLTFLQATGLAPGDIRKAAHDPGFLCGVIDHVMGDEDMLLHCADALGFTAQLINSAWQRLRPAEFDHTA